jgi:hypothetical protein
MRFRKDAPWMIRPLTSVIATVLQAALAVTFLIIWSDPNATDVGVWERVVAVSQATYISAVIWGCYLVQRKAARLKA